MAEDTLPKVLRRNARGYGDARVALRKKEFGIWKEYTWKDYYEAVMLFSLGLLKLGLEPGERVAIIGDNDPQWYWADLASQAAGGIPVGIFTDCTPPEVKFIFTHSGASFAVARVQEVCRMRPDSVVFVAAGAIPAGETLIRGFSKNLIGHCESRCVGTKQSVGAGMDGLLRRPWLLAMTGDTHKVSF